VRQSIAHAADPSATAEIFPPPSTRVRAAWPPIWKSGYKEGGSERAYRAGNRGAIEVLGAATAPRSRKELEINRGLFRFGMSAGDAGSGRYFVLASSRRSVARAPYRSLAPIQLRPTVIEVADSGNGRWRETFPNKLIVVRAPSRAAS